MNFLKRIIYRICIIVGVIFCIGFLSQFFPFLNGFIFNVNAQTDDVPFKVGVYNTSGSPTNIQSKDGVLSNIFVDDTQNPLSSFSYYLFGVDTSTCQEDSCDMVADPTREWRSYNNLSNNLEFNYPYQHSSDVTYMGSFNYMFYQQFKLKNSNHYTLFLAIYKSSNDIRFNQNANVLLSGLNVTLGSGTSERNILSSVDNLTTDFHIYHSQLNAQSKWAYVKVEFDTDSNFESLGNNEDIYLSSVLFDVNAPQEGIANIGYPINSIFYFPSSKGSDVYVKNYLYVIENGQIYYTGVDCDENTGSCHSGSSYTDSMDYTNYEDIEVINSIPVCSDEISLSSIICHIKRLFALIEKLFTRLGNLFLNLLAPNGNVTIAQQYQDSFHLNEDGGLSSVIRMPLAMFDDIGVGRCESISISFPILSNSIVLPCMSSIYNKFPVFFDMWKLISTGVICYYCCIRVLRKTKELINPDVNDKIEVMQL